MQGRGYARHHDRGDAPISFQLEKGAQSAAPQLIEALDLVRCERVLQHLEEPGRAVAEMARVPAAT